MHNGKEWSILRAFFFNLQEISIRAGGWVENAGCANYMVEINLTLRKL